MELGQASSGSDANSGFRRSQSFQVSSTHCLCNKPTIIFKAWTDENPGRRFCKCAGKVNGLQVSCEFWRWVDEEKPHGWQKLSLLEARDQIRQQKEEIKSLKAALKRDEAALKRDEADNRPCEVGSVDSTAELKAALKNCEEEKRAVEIEAVTAKEKEKLLRQIVFLSWGGFIVVTAMILNMVKN